MEPSSVPPSAVVSGSQDHRLTTCPFSQAVGIARKLGEVIDGSSLAGGVHLADTTEEGGSKAEKIRKKHIKRGIARDCAEANVQRPRRPPGN